MTTEQWKDIPGYVGRYQVSDQGRVRGARGVLKPGACRGYLIVHLWPKGTVAVHRLVASAFVDGHSPGLEVNHKDGDKHNNRAANLEWVTKAQNQMHAVAIGLRRQARRVVAPSGVEYPSITQAAKAERVRHSTAATWTQQ